MHSVVISVNISFPFFSFCYFFCHSKIIGYTYKHTMNRAYFLSPDACCFAWSLSPHGDGIFYIGWQWKQCQWTTGRRVPNLSPSVTGTQFPEMGRDESVGISYLERMLGSIGLFDFDLFCLSRPSIVTGYNSICVCIWFFNDTSGHQAC